MTDKNNQSQGAVTRRAVSAAVAAALAAPSLARSAFAQTGNIKVGVVVPLTGVLAAYGKPYLDAMAMAVDAANAAGGVNGRSVELVVEDGQASNTVVINALNKVLRADPVVLMGPGLGTQLLAMMPITEREKLPMLGAAGTRRITQTGAKYFLRIAPHDAIAKENSTRFIVDGLGKKKIGIMHVSNEWGYSGRDNVTAFLESLYGLKPVSVAAYQATDKDLTAQVTQMKRDDADAILIQGHPVDEALAMRQVRQLGLAQPFIGSSALGVAYLRNLADQSDFAGYYCESPMMLPSLSGDPKTQAMVVEYKKRAGFEPDTIAAIHYDGMALVIETMRKYGVTRESINNGLRQIAYKGLAGNYKSDEEGNLLDTSVIMQFTSDKKAKIVRSRT